MSVPPVTAPGHDAGPPHHRAPGVVRVTGTLLMLFALGVLLALWGALLLPAGPRVAGHLLSVGAALAVVGNVVFGRLALRASAPFGGLVLMVGWAGVALLAGTRRPNGTVLLPGSGNLAVPALAFVLGGLVAGILAAGIRTPRAKP